MTLRWRKVLFASLAITVLAAVFAWYFHGFVAFDLANWWATCFGP